MNEILLILHFLGFGAGAAAGIGNAVIAAKIAAAPADAAVLGKLPPIMGRIGQIGLAVLWVTGAILIWTKSGGPGALPAAFALKMVLAIVLTGLSVMAAMRVRRVQRGERSAAAQLPLIGRISGVTVILIVVLAVISFN